MTAKKTVRIEWDSIEYLPCDVESEDKGLYQFYGWHPCYGNNTLLYIGMTKEEQQGFKGRIQKHEFLDPEFVPAFFRPKKIKIRLGRIVLNETKLKIKDIENILIFMHNPPWNSEAIRYFYDSTDYKDVVFENAGNFGALVEKFKIVEFDKGLFEEIKE